MKFYLKRLESVSSLGDGRHTTNHISTWYISHSHHPTSSESITTRTSTLYSSNICHQSMRGNIMGINLQNFASAFALTCSFIFEVRCQLETVRIFKWTWEGKVSKVHLFYNSLWNSRSRPCKAFSLKRKWATLKNVSNFLQTVEWTLNLLENMK